MADTITPNIGLVKPEITMSDNTWGKKLNDNFDKLDEVMLTKNGGTVKVLSSGVVDHGTKGAVTEEYKYSDGNVHTVVVNGAHVINPTGLVEGGVMQVNVVYKSGTIDVSGSTQWELGGTAKGSTIASVGATLVVDAAYRIIFEMVGGVRTGVFQ